MPILKLFTLEELKHYNGEDLPMYISFEGLVYDVSSSPRWRSGLHENLHFPGQELTSELAQAPHGTEVFSRPMIQIVGKLAFPNEKKDQHL